MRIGKTLREARIAAGFSQEELAKGALVSRVYVSMLEHDKKSPTLDVYVRLCAAMDIRPSTLLARVERAN